MKLVVEIECNNAAFGDTTQTKIGEAFNTLRDYIQTLYPVVHSSLCEKIFPATIKDVNGNIVGNFKIVKD